jgi:16S rRNA (guanine966-N2)-methyltransferase
MRITGGTARGLRLCTPKSGIRSIRPSSDRTREALFNILAPRIPGSIILDLYAGTGSLGIEALSRGAESAVFVDRSRQALDLIYANVRHCFPQKRRALLCRFNLARADGIKRLHNRLPRGLLFDLVFLDPPYEKKLAQHTLQMVEKAGILQDQGLVIVEELKNEELPDLCGRLTCTDQRQYGKTGLWFYSSTGADGRISP